MIKDQKITSYSGNKGFTLLEILIVVSIIAIMASLNMINWKTVTDRSKRTAVTAEIREYANNEGIARGDTGLFWKLQDLQALSMPTSDAYGRPVNVDNNAASITVNTTLWKGPYLSLQKTASQNGQSRFDAEGNPVDLYGQRYQLALLKIQDNNTTLMNTSNFDATSKPDICMIISYGLDKVPGTITNTGVSLAQKTTHFWLYYDEPNSDDIYYFF